MAFFTQVSDRFWNYVSPRKTQQRRDKDFKFKVPPLPSHGKKDRDIGSSIDMSPDSRVNNWEVRTPSPNTSIDAVELPPSPPTSLERPYTDFEGDTLIDSITETIHRPSEEDAWDANEETIVVDEERYVEQKSLDPEHERVRREGQGQDLRAAGWTEDAIFLFQKLGMRGFEPILPSAWIDDFNSLPTTLFTRNLDKAYIRPAFSEPSSSSDFRAQIALRDLLNVGGRARDAVLQNAPIRTAEKHIQCAIYKYSKWAMRDGDTETLWNNIALFATISCHKGTPGSIAEGKMLRKLEKLADLWRDGLRIRERPGHARGLPAAHSVIDNDITLDVPTLYGVIASHTIMAFVSYNPSDATPILRTVAMFDFGQEGYDVWNSLAIAIFVIHCRNRMMELQDSLPYPEEERPTFDPDM